MKFKKESFIFITYNLILLSILFILKKNDLLIFIIKYINYETISFKFQDLLSVTITILSIFVGAVITAATVLISMCDKRVLKLINKFNQSNLLIKSIKSSIIIGILSVFILAIIYANLDFNILYIRVILLYICSLFIIKFSYQSKILINLILQILNSTFKDDDTIIVKPNLKVK